MANAWITFLLVESSLTWPFREWLKKKVVPEKLDMAWFFTKLLSCGYCTGWWISMGLVSCVDRSGRADLFLLHVVVVAMLGAITWAAFSKLLD